MAEGVILTFNEDAVLSQTQREERSSLIRGSRSMSNIASELIFPQGSRVALLAEVKKKRLISVASTFRMRWDILVMLLAVWNSLSIPFEMAFLADESDLPLAAVNVAIDLIYILDIVVYFRSTYIEEATGTEVINPRAIATHYCTSGKLTIDVLSALPFDLIDFLYISNHNLKLFALIKMIRLLRLSKIIAFMRTKHRVKLKLKLFQLLLILVIYVHMVACFWFMLTNVTQVYIPPALYIEKHTDLYAESTIRQYAYSLYMSVYMLTAADIGPRTEWERIFSGCCILAGQLFQAFMFGEIAVVLFNLNLKASRISDIQNATVTTMVNMKLTAKLQAKISAYLVSTQGSMTKQTEFEEFFNILPPSLKQEVRSEVFKDGLEASPSLSPYPMIMCSVLHRLTTLYCQPEMNIVVQGEEASGMYFIAQGSCKVCVLDELKESHNVRVLRKGTHFGEVALIYPTSRTATVSTIDYTTLAVLSKPDFKSLSAKYSEFLPLFRVSAVGYNDVWKQFLLKTLRRCPFLKKVPKSVLCEIIYMLPKTRVEANAYIYKEGDVVDKITFILDGRVEIYTPVNDAKLLTFPEDEKLDRDLAFSSKIRFRRGSLLALKKTKDMRYMVKISMDELGMGSVICPNLALVQGKSSIYAKATKLTVVFTLSTELLQSLCNKFSDLKHTVADYTNQLDFIKDEERRKYSQLMSLDYVKCFKYETSGNREGLWNTKMKIKRIVMGKILQQRGERASGLDNLYMMSRKLKLFLEIEEGGDFELAEKIRRAIIPATGELLAEALKLLSPAEVENPLLTQFAYQGTTVQQVVAIFKESFSQIVHLAARVKVQRNLVQSELEDIKHLTLLALRLVNTV